MNPFPKSAMVAVASYYSKRYAIVHNAASREIFRFTFEIITVKNYIKLLGVVRPKR
jgi:aminoglycoside/choline kinase family phosphotransferase